MGCTSSNSLKSADDSMKSFESDNPLGGFAPISMTWVISVDNDGGNFSLGAQLEKTTDGFRVVSIRKGGALSLWNAKKPSLAVVPGDTLVYLNSLEESLDSEGGAWDNGMLKLRVSRRLKASATDGISNGISSKRRKLQP